MKDIFQKYLTPGEVQEFYGKRKSRLAGRLLLKVKKLIKVIVA